MKWLTLTGHNAFLTGIAFSPDGKHLAMASMDGTVRAYVPAVEDLVNLARGRATQPLTTAECHRCMHMDQCPYSP